MSRKGIYFAVLIFIKIVQMILSAMATAESIGMLLQYEHSESISVYVGICMVLFLVVNFMLSACCYCEPPAQNKILIVEFFFSSLVIIACFTCGFTNIFNTVYTDPEDGNKSKLYPINYNIIIEILLVIVFQFLACYFAKKINDIFKNDASLEEHENMEPAMEMEIKEPAVDPENAAPAIEPENAEPAIEPENAESVNDLENAEPANDSENTKLINHTENAEPKDVLKSTEPKNVLKNTEPKIKGKNAELKTNIKNIGPKND